MNCPSTNEPPEPLNEQRTECDIATEGNMSEIKTSMEDIHSEEMSAKYSKKTQRHSSTEPVQQPVNLNLFI